MRLFIIAALALSLSTAHAATERDQRVDDTAYVQVGAHIGALHDGAVYGGGLSGVQGAMGLRMTPDLALQVSANHSAEAVGNGRTVTGAAVGLSWFLLDWTAVTANVRYREMADSVSLVESFFGQDDLCMGECKAVWSDVHSRDIGLELALDSTVQWSTLTVGVQWVSMHQPVVLLAAERVAYDRDRDSFVSAPATDVRAADLPWDIRYLSLNVGAAF